jgi:hypothetical protein
MELRSFRDDESVTIGYVSDLYELLRAIDETMPKEATLYVEGRSIVREIKEFLNSHQAILPYEIECGTTRSKPLAFHMPLAGANLADLRQLAGHHAEPEVCDTIVVYREDEIFLWAHDAGYGYVEVARSLPVKTIERFRFALGSALTDREPPGWLGRLFSRR